MENEQTKFADVVAKKCYDHYERLAKSGKPQRGKQWTHLAAVLVSKSADLHVIALGTGTKCVGTSDRNLHGYVIHDSHAEVIARRAFLRYMYHEINTAIQHDTSSILNYCKKRKLCMLKPCVRFHMFISHTPCGDASILPKSPIESDVGDAINDEIHQCKRQKLDIHRTGAKCVPTGPQDSHMPGSKYHVVGAIRMKPGRGNPTRSLSCSDKIAKWNVVGLQGSLLSNFLDQPLYMSSFIIAKCPFDKVAFQRAVLERVKDVCDLPCGYKVNENVSVVQSSLDFVDGRASNLCGDRVPCPSGIVWCDVAGKPLQVIVQGKKQGVTKKNGGTEKAAAFISKKKLFDQFLNIRCSIYENDLSNIRTYREWKESCESYRVAMSRFKKKMVAWPPAVTTYELFTNCDPVSENKS